MKCLVKNFGYSLISFSAPKILAKLRGQIRAAGKHFQTFGIRTSVVQYAAMIIIAEHEATGVLIILIILLGNHYQRVVRHVYIILIEGPAVKQGIQRAVGAGEGGGVDGVEDMEGGVGCP